MTTLFPKSIEQLDPNTFSELPYHHSLAGKIQYLIIIRSDIQFCSLADKLQYPIIIRPEIQYAYNFIFSEDAFKCVRLLSPQKNTEVCYGFFTLWLTYFQKYKFFYLCILKY